MINAKEIHYENSKNEQFVHFIYPEVPEELTLIQAGYQRSLLGSNVCPTVRDHYLLHFINTGQGKFLLPDRAYDIPTYACFLIRPHELAYYTSEANVAWDYYWVGFQGSLANNILSEIGFDAQHQALLFSSGEVFEQIATLVENALFYVNDPVAQMLCVGAMLKQLLFDMIQYKRKEELSALDYTSVDNELLSNKTAIGDALFDSKSRYVNIVANIIQNNFAQENNVQKIAESLHLNRSYLSTLFKKYVGKSIKEYLLDVRMVHAKTLLIHSEKTVADVATAIGFHDPLYFSKVFRQKVGVAPSEFRKESREKHIPY